MTRAAPVLAALLAGAAGCCACATSPTFTVRQGAALRPGAAPAPLAGAVRLLHLGDFGDDTCQQGAVASAVAAAHQRAPFDAALVAGDNLYECGPDAALPGAEACAFAADGATVATPPAGPPDPAFARLHEAPLAGLSAPPAAPVYLALGNHDVAAGGRCGTPGLAPAAAARRKACLEVAHASPRWSMPGRHYVLDRGPARLIVIDSNVVGADYAGFTLDDEAAFVAASSAGCDAKACFIVAHHPPATAGSHRDEGPADRAARMQRLVDAGGGRLRAWLAGHDHDLQHVRTAGGLDVLVSGNGSRQRPAERFGAVSAGGALLFGSVSWGYGVLTVGDAGWRYRFEDDHGRALYCCTAEGAGRCEPVSCRSP
jgi:hypothetical protein